MTASEIIYASGAKYPEEILTFLLDKFRVQEPITRSLDATAEDVYGFFTDLRNIGTAHSIVALVENQDTQCLELIGICLNHTDPRPAQEPTPFEFDPFKDFKEDVDAGPYKERNANRLSAFVAALEGDVHVTLGRPDLIFHVDVICVDGEYGRRGVAMEMLRRSIRMARDIGCDLVSTVATAQASQALFRKADFYTVRELPFSCFRENRIPIFRNLPDGGRSGLLMAYSMRDDDDDDLR